MLGQFLTTRFLSAGGSFFRSHRAAWCACNDGFPALARYVPELPLMVHSCGLPLWCVLAYALLRRNPHLLALVLRTIQEGKTFLPAEEILQCAMGRMQSYATPAAYILSPDLRALYVGVSAKPRRRESAYLSNQKTNRKMRALADKIPVKSWARLVLLPLDSVPTLGRFFAETILNVLVGATRWNHLNMRFIDFLPTEAFDEETGEDEAEWLWAQLLKERK
ncbi:hypothetical protein OC835_007641 [Tilletia horrida]|nr:hypothetical protein OC835_007641 [Tilletia horrida]